MVVSVPKLSRAEFPYTDHSAKLAPGGPVRDIEPKSTMPGPSKLKGAPRQVGQLEPCPSGGAGVRRTGARSMSPSPPALAHLFPATARLWGGPREVLPHVEGHTALAQ